MDLVIASSNLHKAHELKALLKHLKRWEVLSLRQFPSAALPEETGESFQEIATQKALFMANSLQRYVIADDSGLVVPALQGKPGIFSKRFAGPDATEIENRKQLLQEMENFEEEERSAYYECAIALAGPNGLVKIVSATCEGYLLKESRGRYGFGYDSLFVKRDYDKSFGEIPEETKNRISHRYKAMEKMLTTLEMIAFQKV